MYTCAYIYIYIYTYVCIYIYIEREREKLFMLLTEEHIVRDIISCVAYNGDVEVSAMSSN